LINVLIITEEKSIALRSSLEKCNFYVELASNEERAIELASEYRPAAILLDYAIGVDTANEIAVELRKILPHKSCAIVAVVPFSAKPLHFNRSPITESCKEHDSTDSIVNVVKRLIDQIPTRSARRTAIV
jgi:response regulator RpfG family c-di-GMP phosphodiesterase